MIPSTRCSPSTSVTELPAYWRVIALDKYDGELWTLRDGGEPADEFAATGGHRTDAKSSCSSSRSRRRSPLAPRRLPPGRGQPRERACTYAESATLYLKGDAELDRRSQYEVTSAVSGPRPMRRSAASRADATGSIPGRSSWDAMWRCRRNFPLTDRSAGSCDHPRTSTTPWAKADHDRASSSSSTGGFDIRRPRLPVRTRSTRLEDVPVRQPRAATANSSHRRSRRWPVRSVCRPGRGRVFLRHTRRRHVARAQQGRARVARGVLPRVLGLGRARADTRAAARTARRHRRRDRAARYAEPKRRARRRRRPRRHPERGSRLSRPRQTATQATSSSSSARRAARAKTTSSFRQFIIGAALERVWCCSCSLSLCSRCSRSSLPAAHGSVDTRREPHDRVPRCVGARPRTSNAGRRQLRTISDAVGFLRAPSRACPRRRCRRAGADGAGQLQARGTVRRRCADRHRHAAASTGRDDLTGSIAPSGRQISSIRTLGAPPRPRRWRPPHVRPELA